MIRKGFLDLQFNGWMGTDFTAPGLTLDNVRQITREQVARGTIAYCPTVITGDPDVYRENLAILAKATDDPDIGPHLLGIHLEGPFISPEPGARGAHNTKFIRPPSCDDFDRYQEWADGNIRILTVAPEVEGMVRLIRHAVARGVLVSLGHHLADDEALQRAMDAGARCGTHIGNGIPNQIDRHHNPLWWQLACDDLSGFFITDGQHLPAPLVKVMLRAKQMERFLVISDASPLAGLPPGRHTTFGLDVTISESGRIYSTQTESLVGSHSTMIECMNYLASLDLLDENGLWTVGCRNQMKLLNLTDERLAGLTGPAIRFDGKRFTVA